MKTLVKRNNFDSSVNTIFDDIFTRDIFYWIDKKFFYTSINLKETDNKLEVDLDASGMKKEDFKVEIDNNMLMISSEKQEEKKR